VDRLSIREVRVLLALEDEPRGLTELSRMLGIPPSSLYGTLTKLQALGLVMRNEAKQYIITDKGRQAIADVKQLLAKEMPVRG